MQPEASPQAASMRNTFTVGSAAWTGATEHTDEYAERIVQFLKYTDESALCDYASGLRNGIDCTVCPEFAVGSNHMVRKLRFEDGKEWVARMRMPPIWGDDDLGSGAMNVAMSSELATMAFVRQNTDIKAPQVHGFDLDIDNDVGCVFVLMDYIPGSTAEAVSRLYNPGDDEGAIPAQFRDRFWRQLAGIMARLASVRLPKIGSIYRESSNPGAFATGPIAETLSGPYDSAAAFYLDYPLRLARRLAIGKPALEGQDALLRAFTRVVAASFIRPTRSVDEEGAEDEEDECGGFGLANYGLGPSNVLVDAEFNILGVIDWGSVMALPEAALHRFPRRMGVDAAIPGWSGEDADVSEVERERWDRGHRFAKAVERQARHDEDDDCVVFPFTAAGFYSREAVAFRALAEMRSRQGARVSEAWVWGLDWLAEHNDEELARFYADN
ncbi:Aminoglycoside phosphotransferase [Cordyceps fumosorosea ARSEF 2679]|uniref:Aminoglycoside phosphotransferase n=1 Tax=Cordyceps fumosorosea (strain ARSEF 2679) TaxID=1081104 RepID=A0A168BW85_CORFA|nr:Aminoglycoside phosphotransferase [Cordyceps fumosorosea ARSEF 2679]OAA70627.1 Aminoglycoside phosphotransferase [Cordyceps fumosorosea ARSEF 2679]